MNTAKIRLSPEEMELVRKADWILTKNAILKKTKWLLEILQEEQQHYLQSSMLQLPEEVLQPPPKISKGENYKGLPYLILDHPRFFRHENIFAIRTMFWWGNYFSITLHLAGEHKKKYSAKIISSYDLLCKRGFYCCVNSDPWEHHFETTNYIQVKGIGKPGFENIVRERSFIKLAQQVPIQQWDTLSVVLYDHFREIILLLTS